MMFLLKCPACKVGTLHVPAPLLAVLARAKPIGVTVAAAVEELLAHSVTAVVEPLRPARKKTAATHD